MMKRIGRIAAVLALLWVIGCSDASNSCEDVICQEGACLDGTCNCNPGFEGTDCSLQARAKFLGEWEAGDICGSGSSLYPVFIFEGPEINSLRITGLYQSSDTLDAWVEDSLISLEIQALGQWTLEGNGEINISNQEVILNLDYQVDFGGGLMDHCLTVLHPVQ